jgi:hypothetical protein
MAVKHIRTHQPPVGAFTTDQIEAYLEEIQRETPLNDVITIQQPSRRIPAVGHLHTYFGYTCLVLECGFCARNSKCIYHHSRKHHPSTLGYRQTTVQRFFDSNNSPYFEVSRLLTPSVALSTQSTQRAKLLRDLLEADRQAEMEVKKAVRKVRSNLHREHQTPWLQFTGFTEYLAGVPDVQAVIKLTLIPYRGQLQKSSVELFIIEQLTIFFDKVKRATVGVPRVILQLLGSIKADQGVSKPFRQVQKPSTWIHYTRYWSRFLVYLYRVQKSITAGTCEITLQCRFLEGFTQELRESLDGLVLLLEGFQEGSELQDALESFIMAILKQR